MLVVTIRSGWQDASIAHNSANCANFLNMRYYPLYVGDSLLILSTVFFVRAIAISRAGITSITSRMIASKFSMR